VGVRREGREDGESALSLNRSGRRVWRVDFRSWKEKSTTKFEKSSGSTRREQKKVGVIIVVGKMKKLKGRESIIAKGMRRQGSGRVVVKGRKTSR